MPVTPENLGACSKRRVWWRCQNGHAYQVSVYSRVRSKGCKVCAHPAHIEMSRRTKLENSVSFGHAHPELIPQWNRERNTLDADEVSEKSHKLIWWRCSEGHEWQSTPQRRARGDGCPTCSRASSGARTREWRLKKSGSSLAAAHPELLAEWDFERNTLDPHLLPPRSNARAHWVCKLGHRWEATVDNRSGNRSACPQCVPKSSRLELFLLAELRSIFSSVAWRKKIAGRECDIYIPELRLGIEVDGGYWHDRKAPSDDAKTKALTQAGVVLFRIRDATLPPVNGHVVTFRNREEELVVTIRAVSAIAALTHHAGLAEYVRAGVQRNIAVFLTLVARLPAPPPGATLTDTHPALAAEWDSDRNGPLMPELFSPGSDQKAHWQCAKGHQWIAVIKNRTLAGSGCPECSVLGSGSRVRKARLEKSGSLIETHPGMLARWDYSRNGTLLSDSVSAGSGMLVWWRCERGHSYRRRVVDEAKRGRCPECYRKDYKMTLQRHSAMKHGTLGDAVKALPVTLADNDMNLEHFSAKTRHTFTWRCSHGHTFRRSARILLRNSSCPLCKSPSLGDRRPDLAGEWIEAGLSPHLVKSGSNRRVLWRCRTCGHEWRASIVGRAHDRNGCPECSKVRRAEHVRLAKLNKAGSLADQYPLVAALWHPTRNGDLKGKGSEQQQPPGLLVAMSCRARMGEVTQQPCDIEATRQSFQLSSLRRNREEGGEKGGRPLAGLSSRHRASRGEESSFFFPC